MARVTVEDCVLLVPNRFKLVKLASHRARALSSGAELMVDRDRDKNPVVALREIAEEKLDLKKLEESLIKGLQKRIEPDLPEDEVIELMKSEQNEWLTLSDTPRDSDDDFEADDVDTDLDDDLTGFDGGESFEDAEVKD